jgi:hypothetical protein
MEWVSAVIVMLACSIRAKSVHNDDRPFQICEGMVLYASFGMLYNRIGDVSLF